MIQVIEVEGLCNALLYNCPEKGDLYTCTEEVELELNI
jgi:hypothetical protein